MPGSPAEKAGFQPDDILIGIDNNFTNNIQAYKNLLQNAGERLKLVIRRNKELMTITLHVRSIL
jgi:C-terminal processing protease CtpA/Prc